MQTQPTNHNPTSISISYNYSAPNTFSTSQFPAFPSKPKTPKFKLLCSPSPSPNPSSSSSSSPLEPLISIFRIIPDWADEIKELGFRRKRTLYDHEKWVDHRSAYRHLRHFLSSLSSRLILSLIPPVIAFTLVAVAVASYNTAVSLDWLPEFFLVLRSASLPYQLTAPALALLLVFRTEASYSRFEEGRKAWTQVIAGANEFSRQIISGVENPGDAQLKKALLQYIVAFTVALKHSKISCFHEGIGICEQLIGTPIPLSYTRLTSRFLVLWHFTLPIILWDECHWIMVPATFVSAASLFCIEEVGVLIEEPFPMLALDDLCKTWRYGYFKLLNVSNNWVYVRVALIKIQTNSSS